MQKIISLFKRNYGGDNLVRDEVVPGAEWVINGEGTATRKWDGICAMIRDGKLYRRYDAKRGRTPPPGFEPAQEPDKVTGHWPGWVPITGKPDEAYFLEAFNSKAVWSDGTYELCGPKISTSRFRANFNPEGFDAHVLIPHGKTLRFDCPRTFQGIKDYLEPQTIEGVVWHHPDGRMVKIKRKDFFKMD